MKSTDIKIRFSGEYAESWLKHYLPKILEFDWNKQPVGVYKNTSIGTKDNSGKYIAQLSLYKTKTQRVVYISAEEEY